ncbi:hypothetical protein [Pusillimonas noertemannii]|nr:hypothetical protein [Pusillimonas noertemannii]
MSAARATPLLKARPAERAALLQRSIWMLLAYQGAIYHMVTS